MERRRMNEQIPDPGKPSMFLRRGAKGGLYFFSPQNTVIYYMAGNHVRELLDGTPVKQPDGTMKPRTFAVIHKGEAKREPVR
jgi:hypothetical protein